MTLMTGRLRVKVVCWQAVAIALGALLFPPAVDAQTGTPVDSSEGFVGFLDQYCIRCHSDRRQQAG